MSKTTGTRKSGSPLKSSASPRLPAASLLGESLAVKELRRLKGAALPVAVGTDTQGRFFARDLAAMPHFLAAGAPGSGLKGLLYAMLASLLAMKKPSALKLALLDSSQGDFACLDGESHLGWPLAADEDAKLAVLEALSAELDRRYELIAGVKGRSIAYFNEHLAELKEKNPSLEPLPYIAVFAGELADFSGDFGQKALPVLIRLAQLGASAGIHCIAATRNPALGVVTNLVKGNFPCRACLKVGSNTESLRMLDVAGAETLSEPWQLLFLTKGISEGGELLRINGTFPAAEALQALCAYWKKACPPKTC